MQNLNANQNVIRVIDKKELEKTISFFNEIGKEVKGEYQGNIINKVYYMPILSKDWASFLNENDITNSFGISNYGLAIDKFSRFNGERLEYTDYNGSDNLYHKFAKFINNDEFKKIITYTQTKQKEIKEASEANGYLTESLVLKQNWRLVLNLGQETAYNNGFLLHPVYGIPYLSEKAIKGMLRTYVIEQYFGIDKEAEKRAESDPFFVKIFGTANDQDPEQGRQGLLRFANAFPTNTDFKIEADIMNPHQVKYYAGKNLPSDMATPGPIKFITLKDAVFEPYFYINSQNALEATILLAGVRVLLQEAFKIKGIGAKTNKAYGRLSKVVDKETELKQLKEESIDTLKNYSFNNLKLNQEIEVMISDISEKEVHIKLDGQIISNKLIIDKFIHKDLLNNGQIIKVVIKQLSIAKRHIQIKLTKL